MGAVHFRILVYRITAITGHYGLIIHIGGLPVLIDIYAVCRSGIIHIMERCQISVRKGGFRGDAGNVSAGK